MPGIVGIISSRSPDECGRSIHAMLQCLGHESSYLSGKHAASEMGVYAGWVAHDVSLPAGPIVLNERGDIALIFSGECFPDSEADISGHRLIQLYEKVGDQFVERLNGLFSGLLIDRRQQRALLFNDRYAIDRVYLHETADATYFASEAKALLRVLPHLRDMDAEGLAQYLAVGCTLDNRTLFRGVQLLPGAAVWSFARGKCSKNRYFSAATWEAQAALPAEEFSVRFRDTLRRIVPRYFRAKAKIGISLTAGLDTRMLLACRPELPQKPLCYTFDSESGQTLDARLARQVAECCDLEHKVLQVGRDFFTDFATHADRTVYLTDGCFGILGAHEIYLNRQARRLAPIRLTGVFGGEVLRAVSTFKPIGLSPQLLAPELGRQVDSYASEFSRTRAHPVTFAAFREVPFSIFGSLAACRSQVMFRTPYLDTELVSLAYQAPAATRSSSRLAVDLVRQTDSALAGIPTDMGLLGDRGYLGRALGSGWSKATFKLDYWCNDGMPSWFSSLDPIFDRMHSRVGVPGLHKYLRYRRWLRRELAGYMSEALNDRQIVGNPFWNASFVRQMSQSHLNGNANYVREINAVLTMEAVNRLLLQTSESPGV